jgi:hypothetical protein
MKTWAIVLVSNEPYIERALQTILEIRHNGKWEDDIVLMIPERIIAIEQMREFALQYRITLRKVKEINILPIIEHWKKFPSNPDYEYVMSRDFIYNKFQIFDTYFKNWDVIFYLDSGAKIHGELERMKKMCEPTNCMYAHSDAYPTYEWKLSTQFCFDMLSRDEEEAMKSIYNFDSDYFQTTICIYDTNILEETTVDRLYELAFKYPITRRMDQGIINLYFLCEKNLWRQIPVRDEKGFLYDYLTREGYNRGDYLILKI